MQLSKNLGEKPVIGSRIHFTEILSGVCPKSKLRPKEFSPLTFFYVEQLLLKLKRYKKSKMSLSHNLDERLAVRQLHEM